MTLWAPTLDRHACHAHISRTQNHLRGAHIPGIGVGCALSRQACSGAARRRAAVVRLRTCAAALPAKLFDMSTSVRPDPRAAGLARRAALAPGVLAALTSACGNSGGDCIDALRFKGRTYTDVSDVAGYSGPSDLDSVELGEQAMVVWREN